MVSSFLFIDLKHYEITICVYESVPQATESTIYHKLKITILTQLYLIAKTYIMFTPEEIQFMIDALSLVSDKGAMTMNSFDNPVTNQALALIEKLKHL